MIQYLQKKYCYNFYLELWVLLFALYFLWFSSDDHLELNLKLMGCTEKLFAFVNGDFTMLIMKKTSSS